MSNCCHPQNTNENKTHQGEADSCHDSGSGKPDFLLWGSLIIAAVLYFHYLLSEPSTHFATWYATLTASVFELVNTMWWGLALGIVMLAVLSKVPREFVMSLLGTRTGVKGILRATAAGVLLDLCSHGILMVGAKLYERGASIGQVMAFLIASPWNSLSLTFILIALIGLPWTLAFIVLSMAIAISVGVLFDHFVAKGTLPPNPVSEPIDENFRFWPELKKQLSQVRVTPSWLLQLVVNGARESRMVLRWIFFGVILASLVRAFVSAENFETFFGPSLVGLGLTIVAATIIEVCSEGSTPIAADLVTRAGAPGNGFAFLMTGVSTDYTEIMVMREATKSWKIALFLPLLTVPQVLVVSWLINVFGA